MAPKAKKLKQDSDKQAKLKSGKTRSKRVSRTDDILQYDELRLVFKFLKAKELWLAAQVCRTWKVAASKEIATRSYPQYFFEEFASTKKSTKCSRETRPSHSEELANNLEIKPCLGFAFAKVDDDDKPWSPSECYFHHVPLSCIPLAILSGHDIIADCNDASGDKQAVISFLPQIPNLTVSSHDISVTSYETLTSQDVPRLFQKAKKFFKKFIWDSSEKSKCVILLTSVDEDKGLLSRIVDYFQETYEPGTVALWGGECVDLHVHGCSSAHTKESNRKCSQPVVCTIICLSSPSLQSWSVVLPESCKTKADMEKRLRQFKENIQLKRNSLALMCACVARENNKKTEINVFKSVFPKTPLVGFLGDGEYGLNTLNPEREERIELAYSTVFLILTY